MNTFTKLKTNLKTQFNPSSPISIITDENSLKGTTYTSGFELYLN